MEVPPKIGDIRWGTLSLWIHLGFFVAFFVVIATAYCYWFR